jgi:hypothetical protein
MGERQQSRSRSISWAARSTLGVASPPIQTSAASWQPSMACSILPYARRKTAPAKFWKGPGQIMLNMRIGRTFTFGGPHEKGSAASGATSPAGAPGAIRGAPQSPFSTAASGSVTPSPGSRRYSLTISMQIRNITNHNNPGPITGNITSPLIEQANQPGGSGSSIFSESANNGNWNCKLGLLFKR